MATVERPSLPGQLNEDTQIIHDKAVAGIDGNPQTPNNQLDENLRVIASSLDENLRVIASSLGENFRVIASSLDENFRVIALSSLPQSDQSPFFSPLTDRITRIFLRIILFFAEKFLLEKAFLFATTCIKNRIIYWTKHNNNDYETYWNTWSKTLSEKFPSLQTSKEEVFAKWMKNETTRGLSFWNSKAQKCQKNEKRPFPREPTFWRTLKYWCWIEIERYTTIDSFPDEENILQKKLDFWEKCLNDFLTPQKRPKLLKITSALSNDKKKKNYEILSRLICENGLWQTIANTLPENRFNYFFELLLSWSTPQPNSCGQISYLLNQTFPATHTPSFSPDLKILKKKSSPVKDFSI